MRAIGADPPRPNSLASVRAFLSPREDNRMSTLSLIATSNFITVNRTIAEIVGLEAAVIFGELASESLYWQENNPEQWDGWFFSTVENLEKRTYLSAHSQRLAINKLEEQGWISTEKRGMPAKRYIRIHEEEIARVVNDKSLKFLTTSDENFEPQDVKIFNTNKKKDKKNIEKEKREGKETTPVINDREGHAFLNRPTEREDIEHLIDLLLNAYPYSKKTVSRETTIEIWEMAFEDVKANDLYRAVKNHMQTSKFYPAITEIQEQLRRIYLTTAPEQKKEPVSQQSEPQDDKIERILEDLEIN
jgi:hypothetical protein